MILDKASRDGSLSQKRTVRIHSNILQTANDFLSGQGRFPPGSILVVTVAGIALAEVIAMAVVYFVRDWSYRQQVFLDATVMTAIILPWLYYLSFKPLLLQIQRRRRSESILRSRLQLIEYATTHTLDELLQLALDQIESLTGSTIGFFHFLETDQKTLYLQAWSTNTLRHMCKADAKNMHYDVDQAGVWADAVRRRTPIIHNDYAALTDKKGMPEGHAGVVREMVIPILREQKAMAILGVGNKPQDYNAHDIELASTFADLAWDIVEHKRYEISLEESEEKFRTFVDWTYDWEMWVGTRGNIVYTTPSCERITGFSPEEFIADQNLLLQIVHPDDRLFCQEHYQLIHDESAGPSKIEYRIIARDGSEHWIEHVCQPLKRPEAKYLGRRIINHEITERKQAEKKIYEQSQKELMLSQAIQSIQTDIARDLHDSLGQNIGFIRMNLDHLSETQWNDPNDAKSQVQRMTKVANESYDLIRDMLAILQYGSSSDPFNLFTHYAEQVAERSTFQVAVTSEGGTRLLSPLQVRQLFYIFREAMCNIEKYAQASQVSCEFLWEERGLTLVIADNGRGFNPGTVQTSRHFGLKFMQDRTESLRGNFLFRSAPGQGTTITVVVPYEYETAAQIH